MYSRCQSTMYHSHLPVSNPRPIAIPYKKSVHSDNSGDSNIECPAQVVAITLPKTSTDSLDSVSSSEDGFKHVHNKMASTPAIPSLLDGMPDLTVPPPPIPDTPANPALAVFFEKQILQQLKRDQLTCTTQFSDVIPLMEKSAYVVSNIRNVAPPSLASSISPSECLSGQISPSSDITSMSDVASRGQPSPTFSDTSSVSSGMTCSSISSDAALKYGTLYRPLPTAKKGRAILGSHSAKLKPTLVSRYINNANLLGF